MRDTNPVVDYDEIIRRAEAMRAEAIAEAARSVANYFKRRKPVAKPLLG